MESSFILPVLKNSAISKVSGIVGNGLRRFELCLHLGSFLYNKRCTNFATAVTSRNGYERPTCGLLLLPLRNVFCALHILTDKAFFHVVLGKTGGDVDHIYVLSIRTPSERVCKGSREA